MFFLQVLFCPYKIHSFGRTERSPQNNNLLSFFRPGDCVLWILQISFFSSKHWQHLLPKRSNSTSTDQSTPFQYVNFFYGVLIIPKSEFVVSFLQKSGFFWVLWYHSSFLCCELVTVFFETSIQNLAKSFTHVLAVVLGSLDKSLTTFLSRVFDIFSLSISSSLVLSSFILFELDITFHFSLWHLEMLW